MKKIIIIFSIILLAVLNSCFLGDEDVELFAWIEIDYPSDGYSTSQTTATIGGRASFYNINSYPKADITWSSGDQSGSTEGRISCFIGCMKYFEMVVPLSPGSNTITVTFVDASDSVSITRY